MDRKELTASLELKSLDDGGMFEGYASVFGVQDSDGDVIVSGAFSESIKRYRDENKMPKMLWQHDARELVGKFTDINEDENGLYVRGSLILETRRGREAYALMKHGVLDAMSVGFNVVEAGDGMRGRVIEKVDLWEISLVTWGANPAAKIANVKTIKDYERLLRDAGMSRKQAKAFVAFGYKAAFDLRDADDNQEAYDALKTLKAKLESLTNG